MRVELELLTSCVSEIRDFMGADLRDLISRQDEKLSGFGIEIADSVGLSPFEYAIEPAVEARWLLGQIRDVHVHELSGMVLVAVIEAWLWRAGVLTRRVTTH